VRQEMSVPKTGGAWPSSSDDTWPHRTGSAALARTVVQPPLESDNVLQRSQVLFSPLNRALHRSSSVVVSSSTPLPNMAWVPAAFNKVLESDADLAVAVAAITILTEVIKVSKAHTMYEVQLELKEAANQLQKCSTSISIASGCALFTNFVTRTVENITDFEKCKARLIERGESFRETALLARSKIGDGAEPFIRDGAVILTYGFSRVVLSVILRALKQDKRFRVIVSESRPDGVGVLTAKKLGEAGIPVTLTSDNAVAHLMHRVDMVLVGAEAVVENGGIVSRTGTYGIAIMAQAHKKAFYVAAESFKFTRLYPLDQNDLPLPAPSNDTSSFTTEVLPDLVKVQVPTVDYTPPQYISLLLTDLGVLTPSAISDELIKLYY